MESMLLIFTNFKYSSADLSGIAGGNKSIDSTLLGKL